MATKKKGKTSKKKTTPARKEPGKRGRTKGTFLGDTVTAVTGLDDKFYKNFPRYAAYQLICKKKKMKTSAFVDAIEKLDGVNTRGQALGILTKLVDKECVTVSGVKKEA